MGGSFFYDFFYGVRVFFMGKLIIVLLYNSKLPDRGRVVVIVDL